MPVYSDVYYSNHSIPMPQSSFSGFGVLGQVADPFAGFLLRVSD